MKTKLKYIILSFFCLFIITPVLYVFSASHPILKNDSKNTFLDQFRKFSKNNTLTPTDHIHSDEIGIFDLILTNKNNNLELSNFFNKSISKKKSIRIKVVDNFVLTSLNIKILDGLKPNFYMRIYNSTGKMLHSCFGVNCKVNSIDLFERTDIFKIQLSNYVNEAIDIKLETIISPSLVKQVKIPEIHFNMHRSQIKQLTALTKEARAQVRKYGLLIEKSKSISTQLYCCQQRVNNYSKGSITISGRSGGHFEFFPSSLGVNIKKGPLVLGAKKFKLIRPRLRHGITELAFASTLKDYTNNVVPAQRIVKVFFKKKFAGYYIFEENFSVTYFENTKLNENNVYGYSTKGIFGNPKGARIKETKKYSVSKTKSFAEIDLTTEDFLNKIDRDAFLDLLVLAPLFNGTHALGADDLRFYEDPLTGKFLPIVRDLKLGAWSPGLSGHERAFMSQFSFINQKRINSLVGWSGFRVGSYGYTDEKFGVWDIHPFITTFLNNKDNLIEYEKKLINSINGDFYNTFKIRYENFAKFLNLNKIDDTVDHYPGAFNLMRDMGVMEDKQSQRYRVQNKNEYFYQGDLIKNLIDTRRPVIKIYPDNKVKLFNRLPFHIYVNKESISCKIVNNKTILGPLYNFLGENVDSNLINRIERIQHIFYKENNISKPICDFDINIKSVKNLKFTLANGQELYPIVEKGKYNSNIGYKNKTIKNKDLNQVVVYPIDNYQDQNKVKIRYAMHLDPGLEWNGNPLILYEDDNLYDDKIYATSKKITQYNFKTKFKIPQKRKDIFKVITNNPYKLFDINSYVFEFEIPRDKFNHKWFYLEENQIINNIESNKFKGSENFSDQKSLWQFVHILDPVENFVIKKPNNLNNRVVDEWRDGIKFTSVLDIINKNYKSFADKSKKTKFFENVFQALDQIENVSSTNYNENKFTKTKLNNVKSSAQNSFNNIVPASSIFSLNESFKDFYKYSSSKFNNLSDRDILKKCSKFSDKTNTESDFEVNDNLFNIANRNLLKISNFKNNINLNINDGFQKIIEIEKPLIVKKGEVLKLTQGEILNFKNNSFILVKGKLIINGTADNPVILSGKTTWSGIIYENTLEDNIINYALINNVKNNKKVFGGISIKNSNLKINNSIIQNFSTIDAINVSEGNLEMRNTIMAFSNSDMIDSDFSSVKVDGNLFLGSNGDYVDGNQSNMLITNNHITNLKLGNYIFNSDKGVSCGEKSICYSNNNVFNGLNFGIAIKDSSYAKSSNNFFHDNVIAIGKFIKKPWYGPVGYKNIKNKFKMNCKDNDDLGFYRY